MKNKLISRNLATEQIHLRAEGEDGAQYIEGYAIIFNQRSKLIREWGEEFTEIIAPEAVDKVLQNPELNVIATVDHWRDKMLGRTKSGTLELIKDERGLKYRIKVPDTQLGRDMAELISRGDYFESSFIFTMADFREEKNGTEVTRTVLEIENLFDVSVVIDGAYANTAVTMRSKEWELQAEPETKEVNSSQLAANEHDILNKELEILKL